MADLKVYTQDFDCSEYDKNCLYRGNGGTYVSCLVTIIFVLVSLLVTSSRWHNVFDLFEKCSVFLYTGL